MKKSSSSHRIVTALSVFVDLDDGGLERFHAGLRMKSAHSYCFVSPHSDNFSISAKAGVIWLPTRLRLSRMVELRC